MHAQGLCRASEAANVPPRSATVAAERQIARVSSPLLERPAGVRSTDAPTRPQRFDSPGLRIVLSLGSLALVAGLLKSKLDLPSTVTRFGFVRLDRLERGLHTQRLK